MKVVRIILIVILISFLFACEQEKDTFNDELLKAKAVILTGYKNNDAKYFDDFRNCVFKNYVLDIIDNIDFDHYINGVGIKYYCCDYNDFRFVLIKSNDKYYYYGLTDRKAYEQLLKKRYKKKEGILRDCDYFSETDSLELLEDINPAGVNTLMEIINKKNPLINLSADEIHSIHGPYLHNIFALINYVNQFKRSSWYMIYHPIYTDVSYKYNERLLDLMVTPNKNDSVYKYLVKKYDIFSRVIFPDKRAFFLKQDGLGIFIYDIFIENDKIKIVRHLVPEKKFFERVHGNDIRTSFKECYEHIY